jgi:predicted dehydrogenase
MTDRIRVGVVGMGRMGRHRRSLLAAHPSFEVTASCDVGVPGVALLPGERWCSDHHEILDSGVDVVFVCTTNDVTAAVAVDALKAGKHVFCEKPPGRSCAEARSIVDAERRNLGLKLKFGFNHRYHESVREVYDIIRGGRLGRLLWMRGVYGKAGGRDFEKTWRNDRRRSGGGILLDQGIHMLDLFRFFGGEFRDVKSMIGTRYWPVDVEDNAFVLLRSETGLMAMLHSSSTQWKHVFSLDLCFSGGHVSISGLLTLSGSYGRETLTICQTDPKRPTSPGVPPREELRYFVDDRSWELEMEEFADAILYDRPITVGTSADAVRVMELVEAAYRDDAVPAVER